MGFQSVCVANVLLIVLMTLNGGVFGETTAEECGKELQKEMPCLSYATGKANTPTPECCSSIKAMKDSDPKCLCYIMQQTHNGSAQIKSLGIQEAKLLQLPSACQLQNASISFCPKLLGLSPSSPDAAIFTNATATTPAGTTTPTATGGTAAPETADGSPKHGPHFPNVIAVAMAIFICTFTSGSTSMF